MKPHVNDDYQHLRSWMRAWCAELSVPEIDDPGHSSGRWPVFLSMSETARSLLSKSCLGVSEGVCVGRGLAVRWAVVCGAGWLRCGGGCSGLCVWGSGWVWVSRWVVGGVLWWWWSVDGPVAAVVCDSEVGESFEVDCCGAGGEPLPVFVDASVGASSVVAHEPRDGAFGHGPPSAVVVVEAVGAGVFAGCFEELVVGVDFDGAPGLGGGAACSHRACAAAAAEPGGAVGADRHGDAFRAGHGAGVEVDVEVVDAVAVHLGAGGLGGDQAGRGLRVADIATIIELIASTTTQAGLTVQAAYDPNWYQRGIKITDRQMQQPPLRPHNWHGEWNYTITPN